MNFLNELVKRWVGESPELFKWITWIGWACAAIMLLPQYIDGMKDGGIPFPDSWEKVVITIAGYAGIAVGFISKLTLKSSVKEEEGIKD